MGSKDNLIVLGIALLVLGLRLLASMQDPGFDPDSYFTLRQAENIKQQGHPLFQDPLSYSGRLFMFPPLYHYLLAGTSVLFNLEFAAKLLNSVLFAALVIIVYVTARHMTRNRSASILSALFAGFVPVLYETLHSASRLALSIFLVMLALYYFNRIDERKYSLLAIGASVMLLLTDTSIFIVISTLALYLLMLALENQRPSRKEIETSLFLILLSLWFYTIIYKKAFIANGFAVIWQNLPQSLLRAYFEQVTFLDLLYYVGVVPLLFGIYAIYHVFFKTKNKLANLYIAYSMVCFAALWLRLMPVREGLLYLSIGLIVLSSYSIKLLLVNLSKTKISHISGWVTLLLVILFIATSSSYFIQPRPEPVQYADDLRSYDWISNNTEPGSVVLARVEEGFAVNYLSRRANVADMNFLFVADSDQVYAEVEQIYKTRLLSEAVRLLNKYDVDYILLSKQTQEDYSMQYLWYETQDCLETVYDESVIIYKYKGCNI